MKTRSGFVSNSSSSSFIATYGMVVDNDKFNKWKESCQYVSQYKIMTGAELTALEEKATWGGPISSGFQDCSLNERNVRNMAKDNPEATFVFKSGSGPSGDSAFMFDEEEEGEWWGELDYDIDLDRFNGEDIELYESSKEYNGIEVIEQTYYAGRNG